MTLCGCQARNKKITKNKPYKGFSRFRTDLSLVGLDCFLYIILILYRLQWRIFQDFLELFYCHSSVFRRFFNRHAALSHLLNQHPHLTNANAFGLYPLTNITQEALASKINRSREFLAKIEKGTEHPSIATLVDIADALCISVDDLLIDSLHYSVSTSNTELHRLLLDCNETEQEIIIHTASELKATLVSLGI